MIVSSQDYYHDVLSGPRAAIPAFVKLFYSDSQLVKWKSGHGFPVYKTCICCLMPAQESSSGIGPHQPMLARSLHSLPRAAVI